MKRLLLLLFLLTGPGITNAQQFAKTITTPGYGSFVRVVPAANGGWAIISLDSLKLSKFNRCGDIQWSIRLNVSNTHNFLSDVITLQNGKFALLTRGLSNNLQQSLITVINENGSVFWTKSIQDNEYDHFCYSLSEDSQGNIFLYSNDIHQANLSFFNSISKISSIGDVLWTKFYNHGWVWGEAIITSDDGMLARTGAAFIKTDASGNVQWSSNAFGLWNYYFAAVEVADGYIFTGQNNTDQFISFAKLDLQGNLLWTFRKTINFTGIPPQLRKKSNGNFSAAFTRSVGGISYFNIIEFDKDLNIIASGTLDAPVTGENLNNADLCFTTDGFPVIAGSMGNNQQVYFAKLDNNYASGCDITLQQMSQSWETVTHTEQPIITSVYTRSSQDQLYTFETLSVNVETVCSKIKVVDLGPDTIICPGNPMTLQNLSGDIFDNYLWSTGQITPSISVYLAGTYWLVASDECPGNNRNDTVFITVKPSLIIDLGDDLIKCEYSSYYLSAPPCDTCTFLWSTGSTSATIEVIAEGEYWLQADNHNGCITADTTSLNIEKCECNFYVPNAFTPNGDEKNEGFIPVYDCEIASYSLKIFNRWGEMIFQTGDPYFHWQGADNKKPVEDLYIYLINYRPVIMGEVQMEKSLTGTVAVIY